MNVWMTVFIAIFQPVYMHIQQQTTNKLEHVTLDFRIIKPFGTKFRTATIFTFDIDFKIPRRGSQPPTPRKIPLTSFCSWQLKRKWSGPWKSPQIGQVYRISGLHLFFTNTIKRETACSHLHPWPQGFF